MSDDITILGNKFSEPIGPDKLEFFVPEQTPSMVSFKTDQFTSLCPVTMQPDYSYIQIDYSPNVKLVESKSLKLYLWGFRQKGITCEDLSTTIASDLFDALTPLSITVTVKQAMRGGLETLAVTEIESE
jgi:7-cyano-7-deazaguanine reductase